MHHIILPAKGPTRNLRNEMKNDSEKARCSLSREVTTIVVNRAAGQLGSAHAPHTAASGNENCCKADGELNEVLAKREAVVVYSTQVWPITNSFRMRGLENR